MNSRGLSASCRGVLLASAGLIPVHRLLLLGHNGCTVHLGSIRCSGPAAAKAVLVAA